MKRINEFESFVCPWFECSFFIQVQINKILMSEKSQQYGKRVIFVRRIKKFLLHRRVNKDSLLTRRENKTYITTLPAGDGK